MDSPMPENKSSLMGFFQVFQAIEYQKKEGNHKIEVAQILTFVSRLEYTWRVAPQHCPLPIIQQSKVENRKPILMLFQLKIQPPKCPLETESSKTASKMSITPLFMIKNQAIPSCMNVLFIVFIRR